jgi:nucleoside-diphosphate-sugar epimerase
MTAIAVTGATGFIGQRLCTQIQTLGHELIAIGNLTVPEFSSSTCVIWDEFKTDISIRGPVCVHLAGPNNVANFEDDSGDIVQDQLQKADLLLSRFHRVVFVSSAAVYPSNSSIGVTEDDPVDTKTAYSRLKLELEKKFLAEDQPVARLSNVIGPGMSSSAVLMALAHGLLSDDRLVRVRSATDVRDFIYIDDVVAALLGLALHSSAQGIFNISTGVGTSVGQLYDVMKSIAGISKPLEDDSSSEGSSLILNSDRAKSILGWVSATSLTEGVRLTLKDLIP